MLARDLTSSVKIPIVAVLGNHDFESDESDEIARILADAGVHMLDGDAVEMHGVGFAGVKGFAGGFGRGDARSVGRARDQAVRAGGGERSAQARVGARPTEDGASHRRAALRADRRARWRASRVEIFPWLGSSRLEEPLTRYQVSAVVHGHAHKGTRRWDRRRRGFPSTTSRSRCCKATYPDQPAFRIIEVPRESIDAGRDGRAPEHGRRASDREPPATRVADARTRDRGCDADGQPVDDGASTAASVLARGRRASRRAAGCRTRARGSACAWRARRRRPRCRRSAPSSRARPSRRSRRCAPGTKRIVPSMRTGERGVFCQAMTRFVTNFVVSASHSSVPPAGVDAHPVRAAVAEVLHGAKSADEPREVLEVAAEAKHLAHRMRHDERESQPHGATARAGAAQRLRHGLAARRCRRARARRARRACPRVERRGRPPTSAPPATPRMQRGRGESLWLAGRRHGIRQGARGVPRRRAIAQSRDAARCTRSSASAGVSPMAARWPILRPGARAALAVEEQARAGDAERATRSPACDRPARDRRRDSRSRRDASAPARRAADRRPRARAARTGSWGRPARTRDTSCADAARARSRAAVRRACRNISTARIPSSAKRSAMPRARSRASRATRGIELAGEHAPREDLALVMIHRGRIDDDLARRASRDQHRELEREIERLLGDGGATAERRPRRVGVDAVEAELAAAVVAALARLHEQRGADGRAPRSRARRRWRRRRTRRRESRCRRATASAGRDAARRAARRRPAAPARAPSPRRARRARSARSRS